MATFTRKGKAIYLERQLICDCADELKAAFVCEALNHTCAPTVWRQRAKRAPTGRGSPNVQNNFP